MQGINSVIDTGLTVYALINSLASDFTVKTDGGEVSPVISKVAQAGIE